MNAIKTAVVKTKNTVVKHRAKITFVATTVVMLKLNSVAQRDQMNFIESKGLMDEYLRPE
jgi:hypothetical protein